MRDSESRPDPAFEIKAGMHFKGNPTWPDDYIISVTNVGEDICYCFVTNLTTGEVWRRLTFTKSGLRSWGRIN